MFRRPTRIGRGVLLAAALLFAAFRASVMSGAAPLPPQASPEREAAGDSLEASGGIIGQVDLPGEISDDAVVQVLLMPPDWAGRWNSDVQERLRVYFGNNARAVDADRSLFDRIAYRSRREATAYVAAQMQGTLGIEAYERLVTDVGSDGTFEYSGLGFGEYQVVVVAQGEGLSYLWAQPVRVAGGIPRFVDMGPSFR